MDVVFGIIAVIVVYAVFNRRHTLRSNIRRSNRR